MYNDKYNKYKYLELTNNHENNSFRGNSPLTVYINRGACKTINETNLKKNSFAGGIKPKKNFIQSIKKT